MERSIPQGGNRSGPPKRTVIIICLAIAVLAVLLAKNQRQAYNPSPGGRKKSSTESTMSEQMSSKKSTPSEQAQPVALPQLIDLGADKCIPCKMMAPILEELQEEYKAKFRVEFIDVWKNPAMGRQWRIRVIPTQIFLDASGEELYRHEGFFSKEDILKKWEELGVDVLEEVGLEEKQDLQTT
jgi:thioredoxin 1